MTSRRRLAATALAALALSAAGCQWLFGLDKLGDKQCPPDQKPCEGEGRCVSIGDPDHGCARESCAPCAFAHGKAKCDEKTFECSMFECQDGYKDCDAEVAGCETDIVHDERNCNGCGITCDPKPHAYAACAERVCESGGCHTGWDDCDDDPDNGCETPIGDAGGCPPGPDQ